MKKEIEVLQKKAAEIAAFFYSNSNVYVRSGEQIFNLNCNDVEDTLIEGCIADRYWLKFEWYLVGSPPMPESEIKKVAGDFKERYARFFAVNTETLPV